MRHLRLPLQPILSEDLRRDLEILAPLQQCRANNDLVAQDGLVVVEVRCAVGAVVAVYWLACGGNVSVCMYSIGGVVELVWKGMGTVKKRMGGYWGGNT